MHNSSEDLKIYLANISFALIDRGDYLKASFSIILSVIPLILNTGLLSVYIIHRDLWVPYDMYFLSLLIANILFHGIEAPFNVLMDIHPGYPLGVTGCMVFIYGVCGIAAVQMLTHAAIALNRIWALWMPISFHRQHSFKTAIIINGVVWFIAHAIDLPAAVMDIVFYRRPLEIIDCFWFEAGAAHAAEKISMAINEILASICFLITLLSFPLILWKQRERSLWRKQIGVRATLQKGHGVAVRKASSDSMERHSCIFMAALTLSLSVFWGPFIIYLAFAISHGHEYPEVEEIAARIFNCQSIADPVLIIYALPNWRKRVKETFCKRFG
ncbi:melanopsin-like [Paramacrobiotus metropolitanus]|uniref:melanopsin-like n=1 Tax=Paramacrobiotus metropolitanus TaxID=2943436 RepID=UPI00244579E5|nr:melanopsin-like [Paramacrobiotus metropolitanus]